MNLLRSKELERACEYGINILERLAEIHGTRDIHNLLRGVFDQDAAVKLAIPKLANIPRSGDYGVYQTVASLICDLKLPPNYAVRSYQSCGRTDGPLNREQCINNVFKLAQLMEYRLEADEYGRD